MTSRRVEPMEGLVHGKRSSYVAGCHCDACREANRAWMEDWNRRRLYGVPSAMVDAQPARDHVRALMSQGMGWKTIAKAAGVSTSTMTHLLYGRPRPSKTADREPPAQRLRRETAGKILAVEFSLAGGALVDATGTVRRLQALVAAGTPQTRLATHLGMQDGNFGRLVNGDTVQVTARTRDAVKALYDQLWCPQHPDPHAVAHAKRRDWAPPMAWDDDTIDDPDARPEGAGEAGARRSAEEAVWRRELGEPLDAIARDLGLRPESLERALARHQARAAA